MSDVTRILAQIDSGNPQVAEQMLPHEKPGQTLQATALVHGYGSCVFAALEVSRKPAGRRIARD